MIIFIVYLKNKQYRKADMLTKSLHLARQRAQEAKPARIIGDGGKELR
jgi:hypothetical protein